MKAKQVVPVDIYSRLDKPQQREDSPSPRIDRRPLPLRGWLSFFLFINVAGIAGFIFASAWYFPSASSTGVVEQVVKQGDVSLLELARRTEPPATTLESARADRPSTESTSPRDAVQTLFDEGAATPKLPPNLPQVIDTHLTKQPNLRTEDAPGRASILNMTPTSTSASTTAAALASSSIPETSTSSIPPGQNQSMSDLLKRMKQEQIEKVRQSTTDQLERASETATKTLALQELESIKKEFESMHLQVWLRTDDGVEVENQRECETLGTGCGVKAWKNLISSSQEQVVFRPVQSYSQVLLQPAMQNGHAVIEVTCPMSYSSTNLLHDQITLFFVLSPSQIEYGDTYKAQKFFGNSPYGQFLLHGGKPAIYSSGGLRESEAVLRNNEFALLVYRLHHYIIDIKVDGEPWVSVGEDKESFLIRVSGNSAVSLGNVKSVCDTNAFHGRFGEILLFNGVLSDEQVARIEQYLLKKWWGDNTPKRESVSPTQVHLLEASTEPTSSIASGPIHQKNGQGHTNEPGYMGQARGQDLQQHRGDGEQVEEVPTPRTFDPEGVFEWMPSGDLLAVVAKERSTDSTALLAQWKQFVSEQIASVRNFQFGGEVLRTFIRARRDELLTFRQELFGRG